MRFATITVENFLGVSSAQLELSSAIVLIAGLNAAGKSSVRDAVALALTGDLGRVSLKKEAGQLVHGDKTAAFCEVVDGDGDVRSVTITAAGKMTETRPGPADPMFAYVLDAQLFARMDETARRKFLFGLMGVKMAPAEIKSRLMDRLYPKGCNETDMIRIDRVVPLLRAGFEAASAEAKTRATTAKGAWRAITGETYGKVKADMWRAALPAFDQAQLTAAQAATAAADEKVSAAQRQLGALQAEKKTHDEQLAKVAGLTETAAKLERAKVVVQRAETELLTWQADLAALKARAGAGPRAGLVHDLAKAVDYLIGFAPVGDQSQDELDAQAALDAYEREHGAIGAAGDPEAAAKIPAAETSCNLYRTAIANGKRDQAAAERAAEDLKMISASTWTAAPLTLANDLLVAAQLEKKAAFDKLDALRLAKTAADGATKKTTEAGSHHADVVAWDAIGDTLSPDGIPADLLSEALQPINNRLEQSAADAEWLQVAIGADMRITSAGRPYALLSESEQWRVDAMVAESIAFLSGTRLLVLDRMDVLDPTGRSDLFAWLDVLAASGEIDTALVFGTLKALPADLPATVSGHWIENGVVANHQLLKEAA